MNYKASKLGLIMGLLATISACSSTTIIPNNNGIYTVISTASNEKDAIKLANLRSQDICAQMDAKPGIIDQDTVYQGVDAAQQKVIDFANKLFTSSKTSGAYTPSDHEYKTTLVFNCQ